MTIENAIAAIRAEYNSSRRNYPAFNSTHEAYAVMLEEFDELWDAIKSNDYDGAVQEARQVAAMALAFMVECDYQEAT